LTLGSFFQTLLLAPAREEEKDGHPEEEPCKESIISFHRSVSIWSFASFTSSNCPAIGGVWLVIFVVRSTAKPFILDEKLEGPPAYPTKALGGKGGKMGATHSFRSRNKRQNRSTFAWVTADKNTDFRKIEPSAIGARPVKQQISQEGAQARRTAKRHFALALATSLISYPGLVIAQEGVRELREPSAMQKVAPVRAVGIRLSPAEPLDLKKVAESKELPPIPKTTTSGPAMVPSGSEMTATPLPGSNLPTSTVAVPGNSPSQLPSSSIPTGPTKTPERIVPRLKVSGPTSENNATRGPLIKAQAPIQISISPSEGIRTVSAPSSSSTMQSDISGLVATEANVVAEENLKPDLSIPALALAPTPQIQSNIPLRARVSSPELERAMLVSVDTQSTQEITLDFPVQSVVVDDKNVCRAMSSGDCICIVGLAAGESIIEVKPTENQQPTRFLRVKVISPWQRSGGVADLNQLVQAIQPLNSSGELSVRALEDGSVVVRGKVDNEDVAKRIMELTRKLILVPVVDKLEIR
jgi:hypothetical protein